MRRRDFAAALGDFNRAIALKPDHIEAHHQRGHAHEWLKQPARAVEDFTVALKGQPANAHLYESRAHSYLACKEHAKAARDLEKVLQIKPDQAPICNALARLYAAGPQQLRAPDKALPLAERATRLAPASGPYWQTLGIVYYRLGRAREGLAALERGAARKGGPTAYDLFFLAMCHRQLGDQAKATDCYDQAQRWQQEHKGQLSPALTEELGTLRAEAEAALARSPGRASPNP
jgi:tetratricopeptide (TPR) repeat protein